MGLGPFKKQEAVLSDMWERRRRVEEKEEEKKEEEEVDALCATHSCKLTGHWSSNTGAVES